MSSMRRVVAVLGFLAASLATAARVEAVPVVYIQPPSTIVGVGDSFSIDVWVDGLLEPIGAFDVDVSFDDGILSDDTPGYDVDPDGNFTNDFAGALSFGFYAPGLVNIAESGDPDGNNAAVDGPFRLGQINFVADALGVTLLNFPYLALSNEQGTALLDVENRGGIVCVVDNPTVPQVCQVVPEPGLLALLSAGLATFAVRRRRKTHA